VIGNPPEVLTFNQLFLKFNQFICNQLPVLPDNWFSSTIVGCVGHLKHREAEQL
jgi:hypothetical protein